MCIFTLEKLIFITFFIIFKPPKLGNYFCHTLYSVYTCDKQFLDTTTIAHPVKTI